MIFNTKHLLIILAFFTLQTPAYSLPFGKKAKKQELANTQKQFDYYFYEASHCFGTSQMDKALTLLNHCYQLRPENAAVNAMLGQIYALLQQNPKAITYLATATESEPENWEYRQIYINLLLNNNEVEKAIKEAKKAASLDPENSAIFSALSIIYKETKQYKLALDALNRLEKLSGINEQISVEKLNIHTAMGNPEKGIAEIEKLIAENPDQARYKTLLGNVYLKQKNYEMAYAILNKTLEEYPDNAFVYISLAEYYSSIKDSDKALNAIMSALKNTQLDIETKIGILLEYAEKLIARKENTEQLEGLISTLIEQYPLEEQVHDFYALFLLDKGKVEEAKKTLWTIIDINPKSATTWEQLLDIALKENNETDVLNITQKAIEQLPEEPQWYFYKGLVQTTQGNKEEALATYLSALDYIKADRKTLRAEFYVQIADLYYLLKDKEKAFEFYEKAYLYSPQNINLLNNYAYHLALEEKDLKKAEQMSRKTVEKEGQNPVYLDTYAWIFFKQGNDSLAKFYIERAIDNMTEDMKDPEIWEHYGYILFKVGKIKEAIAAWQKAIEYGSEDKIMKEIINSTVLNSNKNTETIEEEE